MPTCEWCGKNYRFSMKGGEVFWEVTVWGTDKHTICDECKKHLKRVVA